MQDTRAAVPSTWADYRFRARLFFATLLVGPLLAVLLEAHVLSVPLGSAAPWLSAGLWLAALLASARHWQQFRCPRCSDRFFRRRPLLLALRSRHCAHCMMPKE